MVHLPLMMALLGSSAQAQDVEELDCLYGRFRTEATQGHCCWLQQTWEEDRCAGTPVCHGGWIAPEGSNDDVSGTWQEIPDRSSTSLASPRRGLDPSPLRLHPRRVGAPGRHGGRRAGDRSGVPRRARALLGGREHGGTGRTSVRRPTRRWAHRGTRRSPGQGTRRPPGHGRGGSGRRWPVDPTCHRCPSGGRRFDGPQGIVRGVAGLARRSGVAALQGEGRGVVLRRSPSLAAPSDQQGCAHPQDPPTLLPARHRGPPAYLGGIVARSCREGKISSANSWC